jgi:hypothetical protein
MFHLFAYLGSVVKDQSIFFLVELTKGQEKLTLLEPTIFSSFYRKFPIEPSTDLLQAKATNVQCSGWFS